MGRSVDRSVGRSVCRSAGREPVGRSIIRPVSELLPPPLFIAVWLALCDGVQPVHAVLGLLRVRKMYHQDSNIYNGMAQHRAFFSQNLTAINAVQYFKGRKTLVHYWHVLQFSIENFVRLFPVTHRLSPCKVDNIFEHLRSKMLQISWFALAASS